MAVQIVGRGVQRVRLYSLSSLQVLSRHFSSDKGNKQAVVEDTAKDGSIYLADVFGPKDVRLPLPGNVGFASQLVQNTTKPIAIQLPLPSQQTSYSCPLLLPSFTSREFIVNQLLNPKLETTESLEHELEGDDDHEVPKSEDVLECVAQDCPQLLRKDFCDLFPGLGFIRGGGPLSIITLCQKTKNSMAAWTPEMEMERDELMLYFVMAAEEICESLQENGYWADFIDPSSGRPFKGAYTNATLFETDERYRHFGFTIEDQGCCKVTRHHSWGSHAFVGCLFTNAGLTSPALLAMLHKYKQMKNTEHSSNSAD